MKRVLVLNVAKLADGIDTVSLANAGYELVFSNDPDAPAVIMHNPEPVTRRERIATAVLAGMLAGTSLERDYAGKPLSLRHIPGAVEVADALIAELDK